MTARNPDSSPHPHTNGTFADPDPDLVDPLSASHSPTPPWRTRLLWLVAVFLLNAGLNLFLAHKSAAFSADLLGHPDEAAHYVTGLVIYDYLFNGGLPAHPLRFTEEFYEDYPKVALGHYPPGFYGVQAFWMLLRGTHWTQVVELLALFSAGLAVIVFSFTNRLTNPIFALLTSLLFTALPLQQRYVSLVMSDHLLSLFILLSALAFGYYAETGKWRHILAFALLAVAAILTKASGLVLVLIPPLVILLSGKWQLLKKPSLWLGAILVGALTAPWFLVTAGITEEGMTAYSPAYHLEALVYYLRALFHNFGVVFLLFAVTGLVLLVRHFIHTFGRLTGPWAALIGLPFAILFLYVVLPTGLDDRYWLPAVPAFVICAAAGVHFLAHYLGNRFAADSLADFSDSPPPLYRILAPVIALVLIVLTALAIWRIPTKDLHGIDAAIAQLIDDGTLPIPLTPDDPAPDSSPLRLLISSDAPGEGAFVSSIAWRDHTRRTTQALRASKELTETDWLGTEFIQNAETPEQMRALLGELNLDIIALDQSVPVAQRMPHHPLLAEALANLTPIAEFPVARRTDIEGVTPSPTPVIRFYQLPGAD